MDYLISFPRSGNSFLRYCIEYISKRPTLGCANSFNDTPIFKKSGSGIIIKNETPILRKEHFWENMDIDDDSKVILLLRDYKEMYISHSNRSDKKIEECIHFYNKRFLNTLMEFDNYDKDKMVCYYENIMSDSINQELNNIFTFLGISDFEDDLYDFKYKIKEHKTKSKSLYKPKVLKNRDDIKNEIKRKSSFIKNKIKKDNLLLYEKYLKIYD